MGVAQSAGGLRWSESGEVALAYHRLHELIFRIGYRYLRCPEDADELVSDTFLAYCEHLAARGPYAFTRPTDPQEDKPLLNEGSPAFIRARAWLVKTVGRRAQNMARNRRSRAEALEKKVQEQRNTPVKPAGTPLDNLVLLEDIARVNRAFEEILTEQERSALLLKAEDYSNTEIANKIGVAPKTASHTLGDAMNKVRKYFDVDEEHEHEQKGRRGDESEGPRRAWKKELEE